jgi:hypothetical protein
MSFYLRDAQYRLQDKHDTFNLHLIKLILTGGQPQDLRGWQNDIVTGIREAAKVSNLKGGKILSLSEIQECLFETPVALIHRFLVDELDDYMPSSIKAPSDYALLSKLLAEDMTAIQASLLAAVRYPDIRIRPLVSPRNPFSNEDFQVPQR